MPNYRNNPNYNRSGYNHTTSEMLYKPTPPLFTKPENPDDNLANLSLAMAYVPWQTWEKPFEMEEGLNNGTIFPGLYKPFLGEGGCK